jgi:glycosyltransferase involved in cell wall biosynthesis
VLLEALASGLSVAATRGPGQNGIFALAPRNAEFFCLNDRLATAMAIMQPRAAKNAAARAFVLSHFSWEQSAQQFMAALAPSAIRYTSSP